MTKVRIKPLIVPLIVAAALLSLVLPAAARAADYYVAFDGSDAHAGTDPDAPLATLQRAADLMEPGDTCYVRGGTYRQSVRTTTSGEPGRPIRFQAMPGETVLLDGTDVLDATWEPWRNGIYRAACDVRFEQLFVNGKMMVEARWPNAPFQQRWDRATWAGSADGSRKDLLISLGLLDSAIDWTGAMAMLNVGHQYKSWARRVLSFDAAAGSFTYELGERLADGHDDGWMWADDKFHLFGKLEALDAPNEWFLDEAGNLLYLHGGGTDPSRRVVAYKSRPIAIEVDSADHIEIRGFRFFATTIRIHGNDCVIEDCRLWFPTFSRDLKAGVTATDIRGNRNVVRRVSLGYSNVGGLRIIGRGNLVKNCIVHDVNWAGTIEHPGIMVQAAPLEGESGENGGGTGGGGNRVLRCSVSRVGNIGIWFLGPNNEIAFNHVYDAGKACKDIAAVHTGNVTARGSRVHHNWIHGSMGIGLRGDDQTRGLIAHHNVIWDCGTWGLNVKGDDNLVFNNTLVGGSGGIILLPTDAEPRKWWTPHPTLPVQNANSRYLNNAAAMLFCRSEPLSDRSRFVANLFPSEQAGHRPQEPPPSNAAWFVDSGNFDFRPAPGSPLIDAAVPVEDNPGTADATSGTDLGAYSHDGPYWIPGATWLDDRLDVPPVMAEVARRAVAAVTD